MVPLKRSCRIARGRILDDFVKTLLATSLLAAPRARSDRCCRQRRSKLRLYGLPALAYRRIQLLWINTQFADRPLHYVRADFLFARQCYQGREHNVLRIDLEEVAQCRAALATSEAVGSQRHKLPGHPLADALGQHLHIVPCRNERSLSILAR